MKFERKREKLVEHCGQPFFDDAIELLEEETLTEEEETDLWIYSISCGDGWDVVTREDGTLTVVEKL